MDWQGNEALLDRCAGALGGELGASDVRALREWNERIEKESGALARALLLRPESAWAESILDHEAGCHPWYDALAERVTIQEFAAFLLENSAFPQFLALLHRVLEVQVSVEGRRAVSRNIVDEQLPVPHAELMGRLIRAVEAGAGGATRIESHPSLVDRTLVFYFGYFLDPWRLVGALFATEVMAFHRVTHMGAGLLRLGIDPADLEFIRIHSVCDDEHARDWSEGVIGPAVALHPELRHTIAAGIASCLDTSARYLDALLWRIDSGGSLRPA